MSSPAISVVMPVWNGAAFISRALDSVRRQTFADWEALVVDDASSDDTMGLVAAVANTDTRVRVIRHETRRGVSAARNTALTQARGEWIAYLDHDDEYDPGHLARVWTARQQGDVLVFRYEVRDPDRPSYLYDPAPAFRRVFSQTFVTPLGVIHRRRLLDQVGGFDESLRRDVDGDLWRRFAAVGAKFAFVPGQSGVYHVRRDSLSRTTPRAPVGPVMLRAGGHTVRMAAREGWRIANLFERHEYGGLPLEHVRTPPVVLDVGANVGLFALYAKTHYHADAVIHCFEPHPETIALLRQNTASLADIHVHPFALGRADGTADLRIHRTNSGANSFRADVLSNPKARVRVAIRDAATVWDELGLDEVDILKIDTEGCEVDILEALEARLDRVRVVLAEYHTPDDFHRIGTLLPGHRRFATTRHSTRTGVVKYLRADLAAQRTVAVGHPLPAIPAVDGPPRRFGERPRVMFVSYHCHLDPSSGAAVCTRDLFNLLTARGWRCGVFTGPILDSPRIQPAAERLRGQPGVRADHGRAGSVTFAAWSTAADGYPVTVFAPDGPSHPRRPSIDEARAFAAVFERAAREFRPDVILTYGGDAATVRAVATARRLGAKVGFWLHNLAYTSAGPLLGGCDAVIVPSTYAQDHYRATLGIETVVRPGPWDWTRIIAADPEPRFVTFVNPEPGKGVFWLARLADVLGRTRPDIPVLIVEGRGGVDWLGRCGVNLSGVTTVRRMANTSDPRHFYRLSKLVLMPSLGSETFGRVVAEAMMNGVPVIGSNRGALATTLAGGGLALPIPDRYTPESRIAPTAAEVVPWVDAIVCLWDDPAANQAASQAARQQRRRLAPRRVGSAVGDVSHNAGGGDYDAAVRLFGSKPPPLGLMN